ncbi:unnamed protein product [Leptosia nina]|uniref:Sialomucin core protein 24 n=1 Tax=Leptosia nina TaxID=320188 RepID=A0AAV1K3F8_9NEOP
MKAVILLCLLSVSLCFGKPSNEAAAQAQPQTLNSTVDAKVPKTTDIPTVPIPIVVPSTKNGTVIAPTLAEKDTKPEKASEAASPVTEKSSAPSPTPDNKTTEKKEETPKENAVKEPTKVSPQEKPQEAPSTTKTEEAPKPVPSATPKENVTVKPTQATSAVPPKDDAAAHPIEARPGFDGASFVGGIILTLGLLAIGFMGFKYYKNQTERNYHTL